MLKCRNIDAFLEMHIEDWFIKKKQKEKQTKTETKRMIRGTLKRETICKKKSLRLNTSLEVH